uniref:Uncharacterized protein n=1 Tax=Arundo donax TaxID=35708 RepID=A0A0A9BTG2_ARUDO
MLMISSSHCIKVSFQVYLFPVPGNLDTSYITVYCYLCTVVSNAVCNLTIST